MQSIVEQHRDELARLCTQFRVERLELFGSAATAQFDPTTSDLDFLVTFQELPIGQYADNFFGLLESLQDLFGRPIDLVVAPAITNPYFLEGIARTRKLLYAA